jgi:hypothetical protein
MRRERTLDPVPGSTPNMKLRRGIETALRVLGPALDLMLALGDRVARVIDREDPVLAHRGEPAPRLRGPDRG